jgi:recombination protein RecT
MKEEHMANTEVATISQSRAPSRVEVFMSKVLTEDDRRAIAASLPSHVPMGRFERNLANALMNEPRLLDCNPREVFREVAKIAALGLLIDAQLGEAYLIASRTGPQARIGYRGLLKLARQSGEVAMIYAHDVREHDKIECRLGDDKKLTHEPRLFGDRGIVIGYYAVVKYKDGDTDFEPMTPEEIDVIRGKSDGYRAYTAGKIKDTPWASSYDEMAKKTCIRRLMKRVPQSPEMAEALRLEDRAEFDEIAAGRAALPVHPAAPASLAGRLDALAGVAADPETGEVLEEEHGAATAQDEGAAAHAESAETAGDAAAGGEARGEAQPAAADDLFAGQSMYFRFGHEAHGQGVPRDRAPGDLGPDECDEWLAGWDTAAKAAGKSKKK